MKKSVINYPKEKVIYICSYTTDECLLITLQKCWIGKYGTRIKTDQNSISFNSHAFRA